MKKIQKAASFLRGLVAGFAVLTCVSAHAHPYASAMTNIVLNGSNYIQFFLNEGATGSNGVTVTVVTYPFRHNQCARHQRARRHDKFSARR